MKMLDYEEGKPHLTKPELKQILLKKQKNRCFYCNIVLTFTGGNGSSDFVFEHLTPKKKGGLHISENIVAACFGCNTKKGQRTLDEYLDYLKMNGGIPTHLAGRLGGIKTLLKHGSSHFKKIARERKH